MGLGFVEELPVLEPEPPLLELPLPEEPGEEPLDEPLPTVPPLGPPEELPMPTPLDQPPLLEPVDEAIVPDAVLEVVEL